MKDINHQNVNTFVGACVNPGQICVLTQYCNKGSLQVKRIWCCLVLSWRKSASVMSEYWFFWQKGLVENDWAWSVRSFPMQHLLNHLRFKTRWLLGKVITRVSNNSNHASAIEKARENNSRRYRSSPTTSACLKGLSITPIWNRSPINTSTTTTKNKQEENSEYNWPENLLGEPGGNKKCPTPEVKQFPRWDCNSMKFKVTQGQLKNRASYCLPQSIWVIKS